MERTPQRAEQPEWREERLRYQVLRAVYEQTGGDCTRSISAGEIAYGRPIRYEDLFQAVSFLVDRGYLFLMGAGLLVCITPKGTRYIERAAGRRRSLRAGTPA